VLLRHVNPRAQALHRFHSRELRRNTAPSTYRKEHVMLEKSREEILAGFKEKRARGEILLGVGAGTGITAKSSEAGGADIFVIYNSGRFRMAGRGSLAGLLAYGDANAIVQEMGHEVLPIVKHTPVLAGINGTDPFRVMPKFLQALKDQGFNGVQNFPTVGLIDGVFRKNLEETGMGYGLEVDAVAEAHKLDMITCPYVFDNESALAMTKAGADIIVAHMGLTTGGGIGAETARTLDDCVEIIKGIQEVVKNENPDAMVICHGGPISEPKDADYVIHHVPGIDGFFGASSIERLAAERSIKKQTEDFKAIKTK
jgi:predicted TIM-barrel enzyme